ncbi:MAG: hypothetical protein HOQ24_07400 [Mycobacteriaceae bacterium]|nr:hypothetical protein [Mycobacteriaceae bacterium]
MTFSPQFDDFTILSDMPDHIIQSVRMPGLRRTSVGDNQDWLLLTHAPTGARVRFFPWEQHHPSHRRDLKVYPLFFEDLSADMSLTEEEQVALDAVPEMHLDSEQLLAGLVSRLWVSSKREKWAVSGLTWDVLGRTLESSSSFESPTADLGIHFRYLWGSGTEWLLRWGGEGSVPAADVARALTHRNIGIEGAQAAHLGPYRSEVRLGKATLALECSSITDDAAANGGCQ